MIKHIPTRTIDGVLCRTTNGYYHFKCAAACGYRRIRYRNAKVCPKCKGDLVRICQATREEVIAEAKKLQGK